MSINFVKLHLWFLLGRTFSPFLFLKFKPEPAVQQSSHGFKRPYVLFRIEPFAEQSD